jgi:hypothetical protein
MVLLDTLDTLATPEYSISFVVHDHGHLLNQTLASLFLRTCGSYEVVITLDNCHDDSSVWVWEIISSYLRLGSIGPLKRNTTPCNGLLTRVVVFEAVTDMFETAADNLAMSSTSPNGFYILVQADTLIYQHGWNVHMSLPLRLNSILLGVSGRCGHAFSECGGGRNNRVGDCSYETRHPALELQFSVFIADVIVRAPLLLRANYTQQLYFFDQVHYKLGKDDHDLCRRGWVSGWTVGKMYIDIVDLRNEHKSLLRKVAITPEEKLLSKVIASEWQARAKAIPQLSESQRKQQKCPKRQPVIRWASKGADLDRMISDEVGRDLARYAIR